MGSRSAPIGTPHIWSFLRLFQWVAAVWLGSRFGAGSQLDYRFEGNLSQEAEVAAAFLDEKKCPGARGLSEESKAKLAIGAFLRRPALAPRRDNRGRLPLRARAPLPLRLSDSFREHFFFPLILRDRLQPGIQLSKTGFSLQRKLLRRSALS
jgi:hypothetical protein